MLCLIDASAPDPNDGVALDTALLHALDEKGIGEALRFWESPRPVVIVGHSNAVDREVYEAACLADGVPIVQRVSGGGAVVVGRGCLNYSLALSLDARPELRDVKRSYRLILGRIVRALGLPGLAVRGTSDLALGERKVSGSAQRRGRRALLHHGTLLYDFDMRLMDRYLREPVRQPAYRAGRRHAAFVGNAPLAPEVIKARLAGAWSAVASGLSRTPREVLNPVS